MDEPVKSTGHRARILALLALLAVGAATTTAFVPRDGPTKGLWAWGDNESGQLGLGVVDPLPRPRRIAALSNVISATGGEAHTLAVMSDGTVWSWGNNEKGQLGQGTQGSRDRPARIDGLGGVRSIAAGSQSSYALLANDVVMAWGSNTTGALGDG